jgi:hypothetical protein
MRCCDVTSPLSDELASCPSLSESPLMATLLSPEVSCPSLSEIPLMATLLFSEVSYVPLQHVYDVQDENVSHDGSWVESEDSTTINADQEVISYKCGSGILASKSQLETQPTEVVQMVQL